jgi:hypothetical protein
MKINFKNIFILFLLILIESYLSGCFTAGTHGSIKNYQYTTTRKNLEKAVLSVINKNQKIYIDSIENYMIDVTDGKHDTIKSNHYNDGKNYVTIFIIDSLLKNEYVLSYNGTESDSISGITICYINGKSEGNGKFNGISNKSEIILFESELVNKIDKELNLVRIEN